MQNYVPVLVFILLGLAFGIFPILAGKLLGPHRPDSEKKSPYECGFEPFEDARMKFDVRFYLVAILFIIFDLEVAFLFPWAVSLNILPEYAYLAMAIFLIELIVGYIYVWKKRGLEWQ